MTRPELHIIDSDGTNLERITFISAYKHNPAWSHWTGGIARG